MLRKERFLAKFNRDPLLVSIPFLKPGQSPCPVALGGPVFSAITTAFMTQAEEMVGDMSDLCHQQDCLAQEAGKAEKEREKMCRQVQDLGSVVRGEIERLEQDLKSKKEELTQCKARRQVLEASALALKEYQPVFQGYQRLVQLGQVHPRRKRKINKKDTLACLHKKGRSTISHT